MQTGNTNQKMSYLFRKGRRGAAARLLMRLLTCRCSSPTPAEEVAHLLAASGQPKGPAAPGLAEGNRAAAQGTLEAARSPCSRESERQQLSKRRAVKAC